MRNVNQLKAGTLLSYVNLAISTIIPLLYTPIMLRILGQEEYGLYGLSNSVISYLSLLTLGIGSAVPRYLVRYRTEDHNGKDMVERVAGLFMLIYLGIALVTVVVGLGITFFSGSVFANGLSAAEIAKLNKLIIIMTISTAVTFISATYTSIVISYERYLYRRLLDIAMSIATPIFNLVMLYAGFASVGMAMVSAVIQIVAFLINVYYCNRKLGVSPKFHNLPFHLLKEIFAFTAFVFVGLIADLLYWATDKVLIGAMIGTTAVAVYNIGTTFNSMLQNMASAISGVFGTRVNQLVFSHRPMEEISELMIRVGRMQYLIVALVLSGFIAFGKPFLLLWAGQEYGEAYIVALVTMIPLAIPLIQNIAFNTAVALNRHQFRSILYVVLAVANVVGTYLLIPTMGLVGAALCTCVVFTIGHGMIMNWFYYKKLGLDIPCFWLNILKMTFVPGMMVTAALLMQRYVLPIDTLWSLATAVLVFTMIYCSLSWVISMNRYEKNIFIGFVKKLIRK